MAATSGKSIRGLNFLWHRAYPSSIPCKKQQVACKPGSVVTPKHHGCSFIYDAGHPTPPAAHPAVERTESRRWLPKEPVPPVWPCSRWGLPSRLSCLNRWCALTAPFHPYLENRERFCLEANFSGGLLSVALARSLRTVDVIHHRVQWSPDFPLRRNSTQRTPGHLQQIV